MIELAKVSAAIDAPVDAVFQYVSNMENYQYWFPGIIHITSANALAHGVVGKQYEETITLPSGKSSILIEVKQSDRNSLFLTQGDLAGIEPQMTVTFSENEQQQCLVDLRYHSREPVLAEDSDTIIALKADLGTRAKAGITQLKSLMEQITRSQS